jgi:hypothetical protein
MGSEELTVGGSGGDGGDAERKRRSGLVTSFWHARSRSTAWSTTRHGSFGSLATARQAEEVGDGVASSIIPGAKRDGGEILRREIRLQNSQRGEGSGLQLALDVETATTAPWPERRRVRTRRAVVR